MSGACCANRCPGFETQVSGRSEEQVFANIVNGCFSILGDIREVPLRLGEGTNRIIQFKLGPKNLCLYVGLGFSPQSCQ